MSHVGHIPRNCPICRVSYRGTAGSNKILAHLTGKSAIKATGPVVKVAKSTSCAHLGEETGRKIECGTCAGKIQLKVFSCSQFGECTVGKPVDGMACCVKCSHYEPKQAIAPIPRVFHRVWLGGPMPDEFVRYGQSWLDHHPGWELWTWDESNLGPLRLDEMKAWGQADGYSQMSDVIRYTAILRYGGVYIDTDFECFKNIEPLLTGQSFVGARESPKWIASAFFAAAAGHPSLAKVVKRMTEDGIPPGKSRGWTGPQMLTEMIGGDVVKLYGPAEFYPYSFEQRATHKGRVFPDAYAAHHWAYSWQ